MFCSLSIFVIASATGLVRPVMAQEEPLFEQGYEREELGVILIPRRRSRAFSSSSIILDHCLLSNCSESFPKRSPSSHEQKGLIFGGLIADGFLVVEIELRIKNSAFDWPGWLVARTGDQRGGNRVGFFNAKAKILA